MKTFYFAVSATVDASSEEEAKEKLDAIQTDDISFDISEVDQN